MKAKRVENQGGEGGSSLGKWRFWFGVWSVGEWRVMGW